MMLTDRPVVLASASAARKAMLERAGVSVVAQAAAVDEEEIKHSFRAAGLKADEVSEALGELSPRERTIIAQRRLRDDGATLEELGRELGVSKERVRQLEHRAMLKLKESMMKRVELSSDLLLEI